MIDLERIPWDRTGIPLAFDYETSGLHRDDGATPATLGLKWGDTTAEQICIPVDQGPLDKPGATPTLFGDSPNVSWADWKKVHDWMLKQYLIGHNAKIDLWFAYCGLRECPGMRFDLSDNLYWDTMVTESLLSPNQLIDINTVAKRYGVGGHTDETDRRMKLWAKNNKIDKQVRYDCAPWDLLEPYLIGDLERTWAVYQIQKHRVQEGEISKATFQREMALIKTLFNMERRGMPYQVDESKDAATKAAYEMREIERRLPFDPHGNKAVLAAMLEAKVPMNKTESGKWSVDQAAVVQAVSMGVPWAEDYLRWSKLHKAESLWYSGWADKAGADGRIRADYRQTKTWDDGKPGGTVSGRLAVSRVNVQAIPNAHQILDGYPTMQSLIRAEAPLEVYEADISQAEMRVAAELAGCTPMLDGFKQGFDAHDSTTRLIWGIEKDDPEWGKRRSVAKRLGFGVIYGAGIRTLAAQIKMFTGQDLGQDGVRALWDQYRAAFPELFAFSADCVRQVEKTGRLLLPGGKIRAFHPNESTYKAMNAVIQGGVATAMNQAMIEIERELPGILIGQVHDSVLVETNSVKAGFAAALITRTFEEWYPQCPFVTDISLYSEKG